MNVNMIVSATAVLVGLMVGLVFYLQSQSDDASYLVKSKWSVTTADGTAQTWLIDSESGAISIRSIEGTTATVQEFFGGKEYTYTTDHKQPATKSFEEETAEFCAPIVDDDVDCAVFYKEHQSTLASMSETLTGTKHLCESTDSELLSATTIGSDGNLSVGGFIVSMVNGSPSAILDHAGNSMATINSFEDVEEVKLTGCDTSEEATYLDAIANVADSRRKLGEVDAEVMKARMLVDEVILQHITAEDRGEATRHLLTLGGGMSNPQINNGAGTTTSISAGCGDDYVPGGVRDTVQKNTYGLSSAPTILNTWGNPKTTFGAASTSWMINVGGSAVFNSSKGTPLCQGEGNRWMHRNSKTNWCGSFSNREHTPCPAYGTWFNNPHANNAQTTYIGKFDWKTDGACRRHDHGVRFEYIRCGCRLGCKIDEDLHKGSDHNRSVNAVFAPSGIAKIERWGCYMMGYQRAWEKVKNVNRWRYNTSSKFTERILLGTTRYAESRKSSHHYGYFIPFRYCHSDKTHPFLPNKAPSSSNGNGGKSPWWENDYNRNLFPNYPLGQGKTWSKTLGYWN